MQKISIDTYISPQEVGLSVGGAAIQEKVALLIQQFGEDIILPHLRRFTERSRVEGILDDQPPRSLFFNSTRFPTHL